jgi:hypothetical protein
MSIVTTTYCDLKGCSRYCEGMLTSEWVVVARCMAMPPHEVMTHQFCSADHAVMYLEA